MNNCTDWRGPPRAVVFLLPYLFVHVSIRVNEVLHCLLSSKLGGYEQSRVCITGSENSSGGAFLGPAMVASVVYVHEQGGSCGGQEADGADLSSPGDL